MCRGMYQHQRKWQWKELLAYTHLINRAYAAIETDCSTQPRNFFNSGRIFLYSAMSSNQAWSMVGSPKQSSINMWCMCPSPFSQNLLCITRQVMKDIYLSMTRLSRNWYTWNIIPAVGFLTEYDIKLIYYLFLSVALGLLYLLLL